MKNFLLAIFLLLIGHTSVAHAQSLLQYPIPDLGYCRDAKECYLYCEIPEHKPACWSYGAYTLGPSVLGETTDTTEDKEMEAEAKNRGITFPIPELGSCANVRECRSYCDNPTHRDACSAFAKKHGFDKGEGGPDDTKKQELLQYARTELGCDSYEACRRICETDHERCEAFSRRHGINSGEGDTHKAEMLERARTELGCDSFESCKKLCEENRERCMTFTKKHGYDQGGSTGDQGGKKTRGPGGCDSEESCRKYCQEHPKECQGFQDSRESSSGERKYLGPSGCRTTEECKSYCETNPTACPGFRAQEGSQPSTYQPSPYNTPPPTTQNQPSQFTPLP